MVGLEIWHYKRDVWVFQLNWFPTGSNEASLWGGSGLT